MKKVLGMILALVMLLSVAPISVVAVEAETTWTKVESLADIGENDKVAIVITTQKGGSFVLPNTPVATAASSAKNIAQTKGTITENGLTVEGDAATYGWTVKAVEGGYTFQAGDNYLIGKAGDFHASIATTSTPTVWSIITKQNLLGYQDQSGNWRTLCFDGVGTNDKCTNASHNSWATYKVVGYTDPSADAYGHVQTNVLTFWKLTVSCTTCVDVEPKDHKCDACGKELSTCADTDPKDHNCDHCGKEGITECEDVLDPKDHNCDICGKKDITEHVDNDSDKICDVCETALCKGSHTDANPKDHKCDVCQFVMSECEDADPKDHKCDTCDKPLSKCEDSTEDDDHLCDICKAEDITECSDAANDGDHKCDVCGAEDVTEHKWADATIEAPKTCTECGATDGEPLPLSPTPEGSHWVKVDSLDEIGKGEMLAITITIDGVTYILPNVEAKNEASAPTTDTQATISEDGRFLTVESGHKGFNWTVIPTEGGFYIKAGNMYLWVDNDNEGVRITETKAPTVWYEHDVCKLLCSVDATSGKTRSLCVAKGTWNSYPIGADGRAHSSVRNNNVLGLWKYVPVAEESPETGDTTVSVVAALMALSVIGAAVVISKKKEF